MAEPRYVYLVMETDGNGEQTVVVACEDVQIAEEIATRVGGHVDSVVVIGGSHE